MKKPRKVVVTNHYGLWNYLFADIKIDNGTIEQYPFSLFASSFGDQFLFTICCNRFTKRLLRRVWFRHILKRWKVYNVSDSQILFLNPALPLVDECFFEYLESKRIPYSLLFVDTIQCMGSQWFRQVKPLLKYFDGRIYTYDETDAVANQWIFTRSYYSKLDLPEIKIEYDAFLILYDKGRAQKAVHIYDILTRIGVKCLFYISGVSDTFIEENTRSGIIYNKIIDYVDIIGFVKKSRVIVELCQENQTSNTLRAFEAVVYGKRLVTDNCRIVSFPFYDETKMKIIVNPEELMDFPMDFYKSDPLPSNYDGRLSPLELFKKMNQTN